MQEGGRGIGRRDVIKRRIVICLRSYSAIIIISVAAAEAAASARFFVEIYSGAAQAQQQHPRISCRK